MARVSQQPNSSRQTRFIKLELEGTHAQSLLAWAKALFLLAIAPIDRKIAPFSS